MTPRFPRTLPLAAALGAVAIGAGGGAAGYAAFGSGGTKTVVEIAVSKTQASPFPFGGSQTQRGQASGFVYDGSGRIVTNEHVVAGASSVSVRFWNGATYKARVVG